MVNARFDCDNLFTTASTGDTLRRDAPELQERSRRHNGRTTVTVVDSVRVSGTIGGSTFGRFRKTSVTHQEMMQHLEYTIRASLFLLGSGSTATFNNTEELQWEDD